MATVRDVYDFLDSVAPFSAQMSFDNSGLQVGGWNWEVRAAAVALDATPEVIAQAAQAGAGLLITHHPVLYRARKQLPDGDPAFQLARLGIASIACHTSLDCAPGGVNDVLAGRLGLRDVIVLPTAEGPAPCVRIGTVAETTAEGLARLVGERLGAAVRCTDGGQSITRVAVCGGEGGSFLPEILGKAEAYVLGDADYHDFLAARQAGLTLVAAGHFETEVPVVEALSARLREKFPQISWIAMQETSGIRHC
ncbi:MAG: Nif3-like dinuclear metal center hexameric protein [Oscillospiraceae bacterium]|jgi:dinuclear metal center YbgI/SA1388 family protein|nr:Nif3-like dinuclear metal center hexameric protein [Oscillospiraceae bacterium]